MEVVALDEAIMRRAARIRGAVRPQGQAIGLPDVITGATALHDDLTLVTRNPRPFGRIPGLTPYESG